MVVAGALCCEAGAAGSTVGFKMALGNGNTRSEVKFWGKGIVTSRKPWSSISDPALPPLPRYATVQGIQKVRDGEKIDRWRELKHLFSHKCRWVAMHQNFDDVTAGMLLRCL